MTRDAELLGPQAANRHVFLLLYSLLCLLTYILLIQRSMFRNRITKTNRTVGLSGGMGWHNGPCMQIAECRLQYSRTKLKRVL
jgi:hypothetical protein